MPDHVHAFVEEVMGSPVVDHVDQIGGLSTGCATRVRCADGARVFVKAVSGELHPGTPALFRREATALSLLGRHELWAGLVASRDRHGWVTLVLDDVDGRHADLADDGEMARLCSATDELVAALAARVPNPPAGGDPAGNGLVGLDQRFGSWAAALAELPRLAAKHADRVAALVPDWLVRDAVAWSERVAGLAGGAASQLLHWDIRDDNVLVRPSGELTFVDWGMAAVGPAWADPVNARLERVEHAWFDESVRSAPALRAAGDDVVTAFVVGLGSWLAIRSITAPDPSLPGLDEFRVTESRRMLTGASRRTGR